MKSIKFIPIIGILSAIAITTTMDATGLSNFSALPLFPLAGIFWYIGKYPRRSMGFVIGEWRHYCMALIHPITVLGLIAVISRAAGAIGVSTTGWGKTLFHVALVSITTFIVVIITEEGFFRGWLWAALGRAGLNNRSVLIWSSLVFSLWHWSAVTLKTGFDIPASQIPVFMVNVAVMGAIWGLMRLISDSVIVASLAHGLWNGVDYVLYGFGTRSGALGIRNTALFGPEVGILGLICNAVFLAALWYWWQVRVKKTSFQSFV